jgi:hypothetical protein
MGPETLRHILELNKNGRSIEEILEQPEFLGSDFETFENGWRDWIENQEIQRRGRPLESPPSRDSGE